MNDDLFLHALAAAYDEDKRALLFRIAELAAEGQSVYLPQTALEVVYVVQLQREGYLDTVPLEVHPKYPDMVVRIGATFANAHPTTKSAKASPEGSCGFHSLTGRSP